MLRRVLQHPRVNSRSVCVLGARCLSTHASDNLLGHSPMAPQSIPNMTGETGKKITAKDVTITGGVWAPTSAKRDKLGELKVELQPHQSSLDDAATEQQKLDLYLADGITEIVKAAESIQHQTIAEFCTWLESNEGDFPEQLAQVQWENHLSSVMSKIDTIFHGIPKDRYLKEVRDFMVPPESEPDFGTFLTHLTAETTSIDDTIMTSFQMCQLRYRLHMIKAAASHLKENWEKLVTVTDADVNRAAVSGVPLDRKASTLSRNALQAVLVAFSSGDCTSRLEALWNLMDRDQDGLLDQEEMNRVAYFSVIPVGKALQILFDEAVGARPVRQALDEEEDSKDRQGFFARRREASAAKRLKKTLARAVTSHFEDEVEMPHRLRCSYAWAEKAHQDNKIDAVHVDTGLGGRKRYVELEPKISLSEFREVQLEHFPHLDRIAEEIMKSFREDLWVEQGKGRQGAELKRNVTYFMLAVCIVDAGIYFL